MPDRQTRLILLFFLFVTIPFPGSPQAHSNKLSFRTSKGTSIIVHGGAISVNSKKLYRLEDDAIIYDSKRNQLMEDAGSALLFLEMAGSPNLDRLYAFAIHDAKVELLADAISSDIKDLDGDGYLEFGGCDLTEKHPSEDSMYYIPFNYHEIRKGRIFYDSAYSRKIDIRVNGVFLANPQDPAAVGCCKVIAKPGLKKVLLVNPLIISERIDGPANIRDNVKGKPLFILNDNIPVSTSDMINGWCRIGLTVDLPDSQYTVQRISKGTTLSIDGLAVGKVLDDMDVDDIYREKGKGKAVLVGYTAMRNIKTMTLPENILAKMIDQDAAENIGLTRLHDFIKGFKLAKGQVGSYVKFQLDEGVVFGPSSPLRLMLVFNKDELFAVVHRRKMPLTDPSVEILNRGYLLSVIASPSLEYTKEFIKEFNDWISRAD